MKKFTLGLIFLLVICLFAGCGKNNDNNTDNNTGNKAVIAEIRRTLNQNDTQVLIAFGDNFEAKEGLIQSSELHSEGLIALCTNPGPMNLDNDAVQKWFNEAIERTELTAEQEVQIAKIGEFTYNKALLLRTNLTADGLVAVCENPGSMNLKNDTVQKWFNEAIERTELTAEQEVQIAKIGEFTYNQALLLETNLTADGLVAVCENPGSMNLDNDTVQKWFNEAIERTELTAEQEVQIAEIGEFTYNQALLLRTNLTADGLVAVCENPGSMNLDNDTVQKWFNEAIERTELTAEQKALIANSKVEGLGLF